MLTNLSVQQLRQAANLKEQIEALNKQLGAILGSTGILAPSKAAKPIKKGGMSAAAKAKISAAAKARWAAIKAKSAPKAVVAKPVVKAVAKPVKKGGMSAAGKARIVAAQKLRWAKVNAAKAKAAPKPVVVAKPVVKVAIKPTAVVAKPVVKAAVKPAKKFTMSAGARAKISAAAKARWAKIRVAKKK